jgi:hypothetical protein
MKNLIKISLVFITAILLGSCEKSDLAPIQPAAGSQSTLSQKTFHTVADFDGGELFTDKDKCKKCHTAAGKSMGITWEAPYMSDNRYNSIEELINNFDFVNNVHMNVSSEKTAQETISEDRKIELISYLKSLEIQEDQK